MRVRRWKELSLAVVSGAFLMQIPGCAELALTGISISSAITAGGVLYLVRRVID
jgi:hypothetical protein